MKFGVIKLKFHNSTSSTFLKIRDQTEDITNCSNKDRQVYFRYDNNKPTKITEENL